MNWKLIMQVAGKVLAKTGWYLLIKFGDKNNDGRLDDREALLLIKEFKAFIKKFR